MSTLPRQEIRVTTTQQTAWWLVTTVKMERFSTSTRLQTSTFTTTASLSKPPRIRRKRESYQAGQISESLSKLAHQRTHKRYTKTTDNSITTVWSTILLKISNTRQWIWTTLEAYHRAGTPSFQMHRTLTVIATTPALRMSCRKFRQLLKLIAKIRHRLSSHKVSKLFNHGGLIN